MNKKVLFFGIFDPDYARNRVLIKGFSRLGFEVVICTVNPKQHGVITKYYKLYKTYKKINEKKFDHIIVAFPGHTVVWLAYLIFGRNFIFDVFVSLYNSEVEDRGLHNLKSFRSLYYWLLDWYALRVPKILLMETDAHINFLAKKFRVNINKFIKVYVGSDNKIIYPKEAVLKNQSFNVVFHGTGIPLQGMEYIVDAACELRDVKDIKFNFWGDNKNVFFEKVFNKVENLNLENVIFNGKFAHSDLNDILSQADVVLGIFGDTCKTKLVIPNKVYEGWAAQKPVITANTPAIRELVNDSEAVLCPVASGKSLAQSILILKNDPLLRSIIAKKGYSMYYNDLRPEVLVAKLLINIDEIIP